MHLLGWLTVNLAFGCGNALKDGQGFLFNPIGERAAYNQSLDFREGTAMSMFCFPVLRRFVRMAVIVTPMGVGLVMMFMWLVMMAVCAMGLVLVVMIGLQVNVKLCAFDAGTLLA